MSIPTGFKTLEKGTFIIYGKKPKMIDFQFNPESITRTKTLEGGGSSSEGDSNSDLFTNQYLGEKFSVKLMLDFKEYSLLKKISGNGINPILAALEELMEPVEIESSDTGPGHKNPPKEFPQVVFAWGDTRLLPVKISGISIEEKEYNNKLVPISAIVDVSMSVLIPDLTAGMTDELKNAHDWDKKQRVKMSKKYYG